MKNNNFSVKKFNTKIHPKLHYCMLLTAAVAAAFYFTPIQAQNTGGNLSPNLPPPINLSHTPLHTTTTKDKPTMALALSVEFPTVGAQYRNSTYSSTEEYLGYYDSEACYTYVKSPSNVPSGKNIDDYKRFKYDRAASSRKCTGELFSGNFLNWSTSSAIDMMRLALSGGDRYVDDDNLTILQRAVLPNGNPACFWNSGSYFPAKELPQGSNGDYQGAIPATMRTTANGKKVWVANTLNQIYFRAGDNSTGGCNDTSNYNLGVQNTVLAPDSEKIIHSNTTLPADSTYCKDENSFCDFNGTKEVWFGTGSKWVVRPAVNGVNCHYQTLGDPASGQAKKCYLKDYAGTWTPGNQSLSNDKFFYARVEVCSKSGNIPQDNRNYGKLKSDQGYEYYEYCHLYPSGNYKPIGLIQKYAHSLRIAAFGYLMDQTASYNNGGRYGGVLRAPMKYVGPKKYDIYGREEIAVNENREWNTSTGQFLKNPENSSKNNSGVINYLNKFGRTGTAGIYKQYDPVGELFHETLRYLQGLPPSSDAVSNITDAHHDGFAAYTDWSNLDPYGNGRSSAENYACLKSNIVVIGDKNTHDGDWRNAPNSADLANNRPNFQASYLQALDYESSKFSNSAFTRNAKTSQIIGYAHWAHTNDIRGIDWTNNPEKQRPGLRVKTFIFDVNEGGDSSNLNTRKTHNQFFLASKYGGFETDPQNPEKGPYSTGIFPDVDQNGLDNNRVWSRASGDASTYYLQSDARGVLSAFEAIFQQIATAAQSIAQSASSTSSITASSNSYIYTGTYDTGSWTGNIEARKIHLNSSNNNNVSLDKDSSWNPADRLTNHTNPALRKIVIGKDSTSSTNTATIRNNVPAIDFNWPEISQNTYLSENLSRSSVSASPDNLGSDRVDYLRGIRTKENVQTNPFRRRTSLLGDIINAGVTYSGKPTNQITDASYRLFFDIHKDRLPIVITGANDGMLHAFATTNYGNNIISGDEVFAYIPSWLAPHLPSLASPEYLNNHKAFVDAPSAVGEAQVAFNGNAQDWKTVLVSGTGAGGRGVFALNITTPTSFSASSVIWEFTPEDDADIGYVLGKPQILKFKTGANTFRWFAVVASGANNYTSTFDSGPGEGSPSIFLLALDKPHGIAWQHGSNYFKIKLPAPTEPSAIGMAPGIIDFSPLWAKSGEVTHLYFGDLHGNLWKLDFTDDSAASASKYKPTEDWNIDKLSFFKKGSFALPMFIAKTSGNPAQRQPISSRPLLVTGPVVGGIESFYVLFGTGKYLEQSDTTNQRKDSFYILYDDNDSGADTTTSSRISAIKDRSRLKAASIDTETMKISVDSFTWGRRTDADDRNDDSERYSGWYFDFPENAERMIYPATHTGSFNISFNSIIPGEFQANPSICAADLDSSNIFDINIRSGGGSYKVSSIGILGPSLFLENEEKTSTSPIDSTGRAQRTVVSERITTGSSGHLVDQSSVIEVIGRLSWRQIYNHRDLKKSALSSITSSNEEND